MAGTQRLDAAPLVLSAMRPVGGCAVQSLDVPLHPASLLFGNSSAHVVNMELAASA